MTDADRGYVMRAAGVASKPRRHTVSRGIDRHFLALLALACALFATWIALRYANQLPLDLYSFRQTQTALTAYWLKVDGFSLSYETPVAGPPWSIPFEFPLYQWIVALVSKAAGTRLDATGRIVSFVFLIACLFPTWTITRRLRLAPSVFPIFAALLLSSPTYVYWGRTFMIETSALFYCIVAIRVFVDLIEADRVDRHVVLFVVFMSVGILQKATTGLPILAVLTLVLVWVHVVRARTEENPRWRHLAIIVACFAVPFAVGLAWTVHTDQVKALNPFAASALTTSALRGWNWGTIAQRFSSDLYLDVVWKEILDKNCAGVVGIVLLGIGLSSKRPAHVRPIIQVALLLGVLPLFVFTNLHIEHSYYQTANVVFFLFAIAIVVGQILAERTARPAIVNVLALLLVASNVYHFVSEYRERFEQEFTFENSKDVALAALVKSNVQPDHYFEAFDFSWSSSLAYLSERRAFMVSDAFTRYAEMRKDPWTYVDRSRLEAVIACPTEAERVADLLDWSHKDKRWKIGAVWDCFLAVPERQVATRAVPVAKVDCDGIDLTVTHVEDSDRLAVVRLRTPRQLPGGELAAAYFVARAGSTDLEEMLKVSDPAGTSNRFDEFSRLIDRGSSREPTPIRVVRLRGEAREECRPSADALDAWSTKHRG
jgi:hypothetical protein